jgi:molybdopterin-containing oxidoreductase family membrane subunit
LVLVLDLGRPERLVVAATHYNFRSIFAWNMILMRFRSRRLRCELQRRFIPSQPVESAFVWRIAHHRNRVVFGFPAARQGYASAS